MKFRFKYKDEDTFFEVEGFLLVIIAVILALMIWFLFMGGCTEVGSLLDSLGVPG